MLAHKLILLGRQIRFATRYGGRRISIDPTSWISSKCTLQTRGGGSIRIGKNCEIHANAMLLTYGGDIWLGDNCSVNPFTIIYGHGGVHIGDGVRIAAHSVIIPANHNEGSANTPLYQAGISKRGIKIGDNAWLGAGTRILDGVQIGANAIIAAGGVVTKSVPENLTVGGVPAKALKQR